MLEVVPSSREAVAILYYYFGSLRELRQFAYLVIQHLNRNDML